MLYYGTLLYMVLFYLQPAGRIPALQPLRLEFVVGAVLLVAALVRLRQRGSGMVEPGIQRAAVLFFLVAVVNIPFALVKTNALNTFIALCKYASIYLFIIASVDDERKFRGLVAVFIALNAAVFVEPFLLSLQGKGYVFNNHMWRLAGITSYWGHPNQLGGVTASNLPFFYYLMRYVQSRTKKILFLALLVVALRVIMLTQSRTAFLGVVTFGGLLWLLSRRKLLGAVVAAGCALVIWFSAPQSTRDRFLTLGQVSRLIGVEAVDEELHSELGSMASRWELNRRTFIAFVENPVFGVGMGCFSSFNGRRWNYWFPPHNTYLQALAEMGLPGFGAFMYLVWQIFQCLRRTGKRLREAKAPPSLQSTMVVAVSVYLLVRIVVSFFGLELYDNYWWVAAGMATVLARLQVAAGLPAAETGLAQRPPGDVATAA